MSLPKADIKAAHTFLVDFLCNIKTVNDLLKDVPSYKPEDSFRPVKQIVVLPKIKDLEVEVVVSRYKNQEPSFYFRDTSNAQSTFFECYYMGKFSAASGKLLFNPESAAIFTKVVNTLHKKAEENRIGFSKISDESIGVIKRAIADKVKARNTDEGVICRFKEGNRDYALDVRNVAFSSLNTANNNNKEIASFVADFSLMRADIDTLVKRIGVKSLPRLASLGTVFGTQTLYKAINSAIKKDLLNNKIGYDVKLTAKYSL